MKELQIQTNLIRHLKKKYPDAFVIKLSDKWYSGIPDVMMILKGHAYFYEVKTNKGIVSKIQTETHKRLRLAGAIVSISFGKDGIDEGVA